MSRGIVAAALVCALAGVAFADNKEAAKESYTEGKRQYDLGDYDAALAAFKKAYLNYEEPVFLFNIAQCYRALGDKVAAARTYRAFLRNWPKAPNKDQVERIITQLDAAIAQDASARSAPPPDTLAPGKAEVAKAPAPPPTSAPSASTAPASTPAAGKPSTAPAGTADKPQVASATPAPAPSTNAPPPATVEEPKPKAKPAPPPKDELAGMVEVEPNFDRPSGSTKPLKWWVWTLIAVGIAGVAGAAAAVAVTQTSTSPKFNSTLPDFTVGRSALRALEVRF